jgi:hypothetical protein
VAFNRLKRDLGSLSITLAIFFCCLLIGPSAAWADDSAKRPQPHVKLLIIPFKDMYRIYGAETSYRCPLSGRIQMLGVVAPSAADQLTEYLFTLIKAHQFYHPVLADSDSGLIAEQLTGRKRISSEMEFLAAVGDNYGTDRIMAGYLYRFTDRTGSNYAAEKPASVSFSLYLIDVKSRQLLWARHFDETQKALSENLFELPAFIKRKGRWITASQMAQAGLEEMLATLPNP